MVFKVEGKGVIVIHEFERNRFQFFNNLWLVPDIFQVNTLSIEHKPAPCIYVGSSSYRVLL